MITYINENYTSAIEAYELADDSLYNALDELAAKAKNSDAKSSYKAIKKLIIEKESSTGFSRSIDKSVLSKLVANSKDLLLDDTSDLGDLLDSVNSYASFVTTLSSVVRGNPINISNLRKLCDSYPIHKMIK